MALTGATCVLILGLLPTLTSHVQQKRYETDPSIFCFSDMGSAVTLEDIVRNRTETKKIVNELNSLPVLLEVFLVTTLTKPDNVSITTY